jgi:hypothetical protein
MDRLRAVLTDFLKSLAWVEEVHGKMGVIKTVAVLLALGLVPVASWASATTDWGHWMRPYAPWLLALFVLYVTWNFAIACERNRGPLISVGKPTEDVHQGIFEVCVENRGGGTVNARVFAQNMRDIKGRRIPRIDSQMELHWRGYHQEDNITLYGRKQAMATIAMSMENNVLCFMIPGQRPDTGIIEVFPEALAHLRTEPFLVDVRFDFNDERNSTVKTTVRTYRIKPDAKAPLRFRVQQI